MIGLTGSYAIGLDIGTGYVAAAQIRGGKGAPTIRALFYREIDDGHENDDRLLAALKELAADDLFSGRRVILAIPPGELSIFPLHFPCDGDLSVEEALCAEAEKFIPFPLSEAIIDYPSLVEDRRNETVRYKALVAAARRTDVERYISLLARAGLHVEAIDLPVAALIRLHLNICGTGPNPVILSHVGHSMSLLTVADEESIAIQRTIDWGSAELLSRFCKGMDLNGDRRKATAILKKYATSRESELTKDRGEDAEAAKTRRIIYQILGTYLDEFVHEMDRAIGYARTEESNPVFDRIYLYGRTALASPLDAYLESRLNIKTEVVDPLDRLLVADQRVLADMPPDAPVALALGLAMRRQPWL